jgi:nucleotide-binding universal stress UspA family protein
MFRTIVVPLDRSDLAKRALPYATVLARAGGGRLVLMHATAAPAAPMERAGEGAMIDTSPSEYLDEIAATLRGLPVETALVPGHAGEAILRALHERGADTIAMTTHGHSGLGRWLYGSVADHVLRHAQVPVLLIPATCEYAWTDVPPDAPPDVARRILVPLDGSEFGEAVLPAACELATLLNAEIDLLRAVEVPTYSGMPYAESLPSSPDILELEEAEARSYLETVAVRLRPEVRSVTTRVEVGWPGTRILEVARERHSCAIAMATHGRSGLARVVLGSVATLTLQQSPAPLLLVRPTSL